MEEIKLKQIENANINEEIEINDYYIKNVKFTQENSKPNRYNEETRGKYSWIAKLTDYYSYRTIFPERNNYVLFFKTLKGAKKNFIKRLGR